MTDRVTPEQLAAYAGNDFTELMGADAAAVVGRMRDRLIAELAAVRAERDALQKRLYDAAMTRTWRNEDGKKFVFVEDIAPALLGIKPRTEAGR